MRPEGSGLGGENAAVSIVCTREAVKSMAAIAASLDAPSLATVTRPGG